MWVVLIRWKNSANMAEPVNLACETGAKMGHMSHYSVVISR